jgi:hypothetical protein
VQRQLDAAGKEQTRPNSHAGMPSLFAEGIDNDDDRATLSEEELQAEEESQIEAVTFDTTPARLHSFVREKQLLDEMTKIAEAARGQPDARVRKLIDWIRQNLCPGLPPLGTTQTQGPPARWNENRILIFTEYKEGREETDKPRSAGTLLNELGHPLLTGPGTVVVIVGPASLYTETRGLFPSSDYPRNHHGLTGILQQRADRGQADRTASDR